MQKWLTVLTVAALTGAINTRADLVTNVVNHQPLTLRAHLSDESHLTDANLAGTGPLVLLTLGIIDTGTTTTNVTVVLAKSVGVSSAGVLTNALVLLEETAEAHTVQGDGHHQTFVAAFAVAGGDPKLAGAALLVSGGIESQHPKHGTATTTITAQLAGVWKDGITWVKDGQVKSTKPAK